MADTPAALGRRYLPFIAVAAVQVLLVAIAPSKGPSAAKNQEVAAAAGPTTGLGNGTATGAEGTTSATAGAAGGSVSATSSTGTQAGAAAGTATGTRTAAGGSATGPSGPTAGAGNSTQDLSHCDKNGRQVGVPGYQMPPCVPVWHGDNGGGGPMTGVAGTSHNYGIHKAQG